MRCMLSMYHAASGSIWVCLPADALGDGVRGAALRIHGCLAGEGCGGGLGRVAPGGAAGQQRRGMGHLNDTCPLCRRRSTACIMRSLAEEVAASPCDSNGVVTFGHSLLALP